jgi:hypothetical protein
VHDILTARGKQAALDVGLSRDVVETATAYLSNEEGGIGFLYSVPRDNQGERLACHTAVAPA